jgi:hypothetical protein
MKPPQQINDILQAYFNGKATPEQIQTLEAWLREDASHVRLFVDLGLLDGLMLSVQKDEDAAAILATLAEAEANAEPDFSLLHTPAFDTVPSRPDKRSISFQEGWSLAGYVLKQGLRSKFAMFGSIAAVFVLGAVLFLTLYSGGSPDARDIADQTPTTHEIDKANSVATLTATHNAHWDQQPGEDFRSGDPFYANQRLILTAGFAEITTKRGAVVILEAPATIELIDSPNALRLHAGKLVGICETESSKGFLIRTPHMDVADLGTRFGVAIDGQGNTLAEVFEGSVQVESHNGFSSLIARQTLTRGESYAVNPAGTRLTREHFAPGVFDRLGETATGIQLAGAARWSAHVIDPADPSRWPVDQTNAFVIEEMRGYRVPTDFPVILDKPGTVSNFSNAPTSMVGAGTRIRSYAVLFNPEKFSGPQRCQGNVTFEGEVLGVVADRKVGRAFMNAIGDDSEQVLWDNTPRSHVWPEDGDGTDASDSLVLEADGRSLTFNFVVQTEIDMIRVIVREPLEAAK